jgi:hypothetical protein
MRERDFGALETVLAPDITFASPLTSTVRFEGREEVIALFKTVRAALDDLEYVDAFTGDGTEALRFRARVRGEPIEGVDVLHLDEQGRVREMSVFVRPLPAAGALLAALAPQVARPAGRWRAAVAGALSAPLPVMLRRGDQLAARLVRPAASRARAARRRRPAAQPSSR